jgi:MinD-like ATPase involved in chromosome partitioning or flagellar assembly
MDYMGKSIGILSIKGGVGKTSSAIALGDAISCLGKKVLLVDANFSAPNLGMYLNMINPAKGLHDIMERKAGYGEAIRRFGNFDVLPTSASSKSRINPFDLRKKVSSLKNKYDVIIIDSPPTLSEETLASLLASDEVIIVTTPDYATLGMTLKAIKLAKQRDIRIDGILINKVHGKGFELSIDDIEKTAEVPVLAIIPHDIGVLESAHHFTPLTSHRPKSKSSGEYRKLAAVLVGEKHNAFSWRSFFNLAPKKHEINREIFYESYFG